METGPLSRWLRAERAGDPPGLPGQALNPRQVSLREPEDVAAHPGKPGAPAAGRGRKDPPRSSGGTAALPTRPSWTSGLQTRRDYAALVLSASDCGTPPASLSPVPRLVNSVIRPYHRHCRAQRLRTPGATPRHPQPGRAPGPRRTSSPALPTREMALSHLPVAQTPVLGSIGRIPEKPVWLLVCPQPSLWGEGRGERKRSPGRTQCGDQKWSGMWPLPPPHGCPRAAPPVLSAPGREPRGRRPSCERVRATGHGEGQRTSAGRSCESPNSLESPNQGRPRLAFLELCPRRARNTAHNSSLGGRSCPDSCRGSRGYEWEPFAPEPRGAGGPGRPRGAGPGGNNGQARARGGRGWGCS